MLETTIVSIIIPIYNAEQYIVETINSALASTYKNIEIICVDDCSADNSVSIIDSNLGGDGRVHIIKLRTNSKTAFARNVGINKACGKYILPLDVDDLIAKTYIEKAINILEKKSNISVIYYRFKLFGELNSVSEYSEYCPQKMVVHNSVFCIL